MTPTQNIEYHYKQGNITKEGYEMAKTELEGECS